MKQLDLFDQNIEDLGTKEKSPVSKEKSRTSKKVSNILSGSLNFRSEYHPYSSYEVGVKNGKINRVKFKFGKLKFQVHIDYEYEVRRIRNINYFETDDEDKESIIEVVYVNSIRILSIQKKEKVGYGEIKKSVNYFNYSGIKYKELLAFLKTLLVKYHNR